MSARQQSQPYPFFSILIIVFLAACSAPPATPTTSLTAPPVVTTEVGTTVVETQPPPVETATKSPKEGLPESPQPSATGTGPVVDPAVTEQIRQVESALVPYLEIKGVDSGPVDLLSRMAYYNVPGLSIAVINNGRIEWAKGYGVTRAGSEAPVTPQTLFQAASMSKPVTAFAAMRLVQAGQLDLDLDVNTQLKSWQLPDNSFTTQEKVTVRRILSHTAGLSVHGFPGYSPGAPLPSTIEILEGHPPANSPAVQVVAEPGSRYEYSGGGYVLLQQLMVDASGQDFPSLMKSLVLDPLGMNSSTFEQPLPISATEHAAAGHNFDGSLIEGGWHVYPEMAPAGLWTTPSDLAHFLIRVEQAREGDLPGVLSVELAQTMLTVVRDGNGMGWVLPGDGRMFGHGGSNAGFRGLMFAPRGTGKGAVVMANSDTGMQLVFEVFRAIAEVYAWPEVRDWRVAQRAEGRFVDVDPAVFAPLVGTYRARGLKLEAFSEGESLWIRIPGGGPAYRLYPDSPTEYFTVDGNGFTFELDGAGKAIRLQLNGWGDAELSAERLN